jgi:hypothetical protein
MAAIIGFVVLDRALEQTSFGLEIYPRQAHALQGRIQ